jgi:hypothetical protein
MVKRNSVQVSVEFYKIYRRKHRTLQWKKIKPLCQKESGINAPVFRHHATQY